jgi:D-lactate dehydrogenase
MQNLPNLKFNATQSTGFDHIDLPFAQTRNIIVSNVPEYGTRTVAEHTFALILALTKKLYQSMNQSKRFDFTHNNIRTINLYQRTLGIIGLGKIGKEVVKIAHGFGLNVLIHTRTHDEAFAQQWGVKYVELDELLQNSDFISLHVPYSKETHHIINKDNIHKCKKGSYIINTSRGGLIETEALIQALEDGTLSGAGLDVLEEEKNLSEELEILKTSLPDRIDFKTLTMDHLLIHHPKVVVTPHNAFNSEEALQKIMNTTIENIKAFIAGQPINLVS